MAAVRLIGDSSGYSEIQSPANANNQIFILPASGGTFVTTSGAQSLVFAAGSASAPSISPVGDSNTGVFFPAADTVAIAEGGIEALRIDSSGTFRVKGAGTAGVSDAFAVNGSAPANSAQLDSSGRLLVGTSSAGSALTQTIEIHGLGSTATAQPCFENYAFPGTTAERSGYLQFYRSRGSSVGTNTIVASGDQLGVINFRGANGSSYDIAAQIKAEVDGTPGASNDMPGRLVFSTTVDGASSPTERMRIGQNGLVSIAGPGGGTFLRLDNAGGYNGLHEVDNNAYTIGQNSQFRALRIGSGSTWLTTGVSLAAGSTSWGSYSDERLKTDIVELDSCLESIKDIRCISYRLTDVDEPNSKKRLGVIAQDLVGKYDEAINKSRRSEDDETEYLSVQYSDLVPVLLKALQEASAKIDTLEAKVAALESA